MGNNDKPLGMSGGVPAGELLPCPNPWCERIEGVEASQHLVTERWHVCCDDCMIGGPWAKTYDEAVAAWNTRATPTPPIEGRDADVERVAKAMCVADGLDPDEHIVGGQATGFEDFGPLWQAEDRSEGQLGLTDYTGLARAALQALGERP